MTPHSKRSHGKKHDFIQAFYILRFNPKAFKYVEAKWNRLTERNTKFNNHQLVSILTSVSAAADRHADHPDVEAGRAYVAARISYWTERALQPNIDSGPNRTALASFDHEQITQTIEAMGLLGAQPDQKFRDGLAARVASPDIALNGDEVDRIRRSSEQIGPLLPWRLANKRLPPLASVYQ